MEKNKKKKIVLLDSHAILHRAYHALPDFASSKGEPTGALYGLSTMVLKIIEEFRPDFLVACFDLPKPTYRHVAYEDYKAGRKKADDALVSQIIRSRDFFKAFNIPIFELEGFEADDMLGTIVEKLKNRDDIEIIIASGDMDTMQLIDGERVKVFTLKKGIRDTVLYGENDVVQRFGFLPKMLTDYKGLRGDPSDNIKGIKGIGEKTAESLIKEFGTLEDMYEALDKGQLERFHRASIKERILELLKSGREDAEFSKMLATIRRDAPIGFSLPEASWSISVSKDSIKKFFSEMEFRSLMNRVDVVFGGKEVETKSEGLFAEKEAEKIDEKEFEKISIALWLLDSGITNPNLSDMEHFAKVAGFSKSASIILDDIEKKGLKKVYEEIELPLIPIIQKMEKVGIKIDLKHLIGLSKDYHKSLDRIQKEIWQSVGEEFNISSPKQLGEILFDKLNLQVKGLKKTAGGARSTKESELEKLKDLHPSITKILEFRELQKLLTTYIDNIPPLLDKDSRLHAKFVQTGTTTGRMSSQNPNLQNIPIKSELGRNIRNVFVAREGFSLVAIDYSQIELRIAAWLSKDKKLIEIFKNGEDVHSAVASEVFKVPLDKVDKEMRRKAKVINFGILYGMGVNALRQNLGGTREEAQNFYNEYFETFRELFGYMENVKEEVKKNGFIKTFFGRRRYFEGINSKLPFIRASAERMAINAPIQGTEADLVKIAMSRVDEFLKREKIENKVFLLLQIHDEVIYEVENSLIDKFAKSAKKIMENILTIKDTEGVPIVTNISVGENWGHMSPLEVK